MDTCKPLDCCKYLFYIPIKHEVTNKMWHNVMPDVCYVFSIHVHFVCSIPHVCCVYSIPHVCCVFSIYTNVSIGKL